MLIGYFKRNRQIVLTALIITLGMQSLRMVYPLVIWHRPSTANLLYLVLTLSLFTPILLRILNHRTTGFLLIAGLGLSRVAEFISHNPTYDLWASMMGVGLFMLHLPLLFRMRQRSIPNMLGLALGLALDTLIQGLLWTNHLGAEGSLLATILLLAIVGSTIALANLERKAIDDPLTDRSWASALLLIFLGPFFFLQLLALQNQGFVSMMSGASLPGAFVIVSFGNLALITGLQLGFSQRRRPILLTILVSLSLLYSILMINALEGTLILGVPLMQMAFGWGLARIAIASTPGKTVYLIRSSIAIGIGQVLMLVLFLISFGHLVFVNGLPKEVVLPIVALLTVSILIFADRRARQNQASSGNYAPVFILGSIIFLLSGLHMLLSAPPRSPSRSPELPVGVMTFNIHSAISHEFSQDPELIAQVIEASGAKIIAIQEISRGWIMSGTIDLVSWLSKRLSMDAVFQAAADPLWGNAILSSYPIVDSGSGALPQAGATVPRGYLWAKIDSGASKPLFVLNTHLHHLSDQSEVRLAQIPALLAIWGNRSHAILLGDLNAVPGSAEINLFQQAGLIDAWTEAGLGNGLTIPSTNPQARIDWIWHTSDLVVIETQTIASTASDHLPVIAVFDQVE